METYGYCKRMEDPLHQMMHWSKGIRGGSTSQSTAVLALYRERERERRLKSSNEHGEVLHF